MKTFLKLVLFLLVIATIIVGRVIVKQELKNMIKKEETRQSKEKKEWNKVVTKEIKAKYNKLFLKWKEERDKQIDADDIYKKGE